MNKKFDLNIEEILEDWMPYHAIREIIANAIDEQLLTETKDIKIDKDPRGNWYIQDFGRGLRYTHLTQNENDEKTKSPHVIGKFGIGLKDAFATLDRHGIKVLAKSKFGDISLIRTQKEDFSDIVTLHAEIKKPSHPDLVGTVFFFSGISDRQIEKAKKLFLRFSGNKIIEKTKYGEIIENNDNTSSIYINGVKVALEENFLFSYNVTSLTASIKKALNRERTNVGRSAYSGRVKSILLSSDSVGIAQSLADDLQNYSKGSHHDELSWIDVQEHSVKVLNQNQKVIFVTSDEILQNPSIIDDAQREGYKVITVPDNLRAKIQDTKDFEGNTVVDLSNFVTLYNENFEFDFVDIQKLTKKEQNIYRFTEQIFDLVGGKPEKVKAVKISQTMRKEYYSNYETLGLWEPVTSTIIIKRSLLSNLARYAGTLLHEMTHAASGYGDVSREFERELTKLIGIISTKAMESDKQENNDRLCPKCNLVMKIRVANSGKRKGKKFYVCPNYKTCKQVLLIE